MADDEIRKLAQKYKAHLQKHETEQAAFVEKRAILKSKASGLWAELRQLIKDKRDEFNKEMEREVLTWDNVRSTRLSMTRTDDSEKLEAEFDDEAFVVTFRGNRVSNSYHINTASDGTLRFFVVENKQQRYFTAAEIASWVMNAFFTV